MTTSTIILTARKYRDQGSSPSARVCLADAIEQSESGNDSVARQWALKSLAHSLGVFHPEYLKAAR